MDGVVLFRNIRTLDTDVVKAKKGDREAFGNLINKHKISMYRVAKSILKNEHDVEDAISDSILKVYVSLHSLRDNNNFKPWLLKILINECYRVIKVRKRVVVTEEFSKGEASYEDKYEDFELKNAIDALEENQKLVVMLFYYEDMSLKDISNALDVPEGTVKSRLNRAKEKLKNMISK